MDYKLSKKRKKNKKKKKKTKKEKEAINVTWSTISTQTGGNFIVEKSIDGVNFSQIGLVDMNNIPGGVTSYQFYDTNPSNGYNYYVIKQVNIDNSYTYSPITKVFLYDNHFDITSENNHFHFYTLNNEAAEIAVYDIVGKEIISPMTTTNLFFGETFTTGAYIIKVSFANKFECKRIYK